jgi:hypothetical protein
MLPAVKHTKHFLILALPVVAVDHQNSPDCGRNPSQDGELKAEAERRLKDAPSYQKSKPGQQDGDNNNHG